MGIRAADAGREEEEGNKKDVRVARGKEEVAHL